MLPTPVELRLRLSIDRAEGDLLTAASQRLPKDLEVAPDLQCLHRRTKLGKPHEATNVRVERLAPRHRRGAMYRLHPPADVFWGSARGADASRARSWAARGGGTGGRGAGGAAVVEAGLAELRGPTEQPHCHVKQRLDVPDENVGRFVIGVRMLGATAKVRVQASHEFGRVVRVANSFAHRSQINHGQAPVEILAELFPETLQAPISAMDELGKTLDDPVRFFVQILQRTKAFVIRVAPLYQVLQVAAVAQFPSGCAQLVVVEFSFILRVQNQLPRCDHRTEPAVAQ
mmetsp:Transcript_54604/g.165966  ORF Transcript_54604/g.165966 Transcript_54604/m.165966 type:complete len:287 (+) Transcript_54604:968-1828(+)